MQKGKCFVKRNIIRLLALVLLCMMSLT